MFWRRRRWALRRSRLPAGSIGMRRVMVSSFAAARGSLAMVQRTAVPGWRRSIAEGAEAVLAGMAVNLWGIVKIGRGSCEGEVYQAPRAGPLGGSWKGDGRGYTSPP